MLDIPEGRLVEFEDEVNKFLDEFGIRLIKFTIMREKRNKIFEKQNNLVGFTCHHNDRRWQKCKSFSHQIDTPTDLWQKAVWTIDLNTYPSMALVFRYLPMDFSVAFQ